MTRRARGGYSGHGARRPPTAAPARSAASSNAVPTGGLAIEASEHTGRSPVAGRLALLVATGAGAGYAPLAPGSFGSALGVLLYLPLAGLGAAPYLLATLALASLGIWAADVAERVLARKDDGRIVIDEVVGQLVALAPLVALAGPGRLREPAWLVTGFVAFRLFDVWKPGPVRWAERRFLGGAGVVLDDVAAGLLAAAVLALLVAIA